MLLLFIMVVHSHKATASGKVSSPLQHFSLKTKERNDGEGGEGRKRQCEVVRPFFCGEVHCWLNPCHCGIVVLLTIYSIETSSSVFTEYIVMDFRTFIYLDVHNGSE